ncbi:MAG: Lrp/AsnC family transcriptional regulator [Candidatus Aenigmatarchaeota archaeon]
MSIKLAKKLTKEQKIGEHAAATGRTVDALDSKILRHLLADSRLSYRTVAEMLGVSVGTVASRVRELENGGVIKGYTALLDYERLGYQLSALIELSVSKGKLIEVERRIARMPGVCCVYDITGLTDALVVAKFRSRHELNAFVKSLLAMPYVERTNTHMVLNTVKESLSPE